jgi:hypothetical protein
VYHLWNLFEKTAFLFFGELNPTKPNLSYDGGSPLPPKKIITYDFITDVKSGHLWNLILAVFTL